MKKCSHCGFEQEDGQFCGNCGNPLDDNHVDEAASQDDPIETQEEREDTYQTQSSVEREFTDEEPEVMAGVKQQAASESLTSEQVHTKQGQSDEQNDTVERVKQVSNDYWSYFIYYLKYPLQIFDNQKEEFVNGLISLILVAGLLALNTYFMMRNLLAVSFGFAMDVAGPPFFSVFTTTFLFIAVSLALVALILFGVSKFFGPSVSYKDLISLYGGHLNHAIFLSVISFVLLLVKANTVGMLLLFFILGTVLTSVPLYLINRLLTKKSKSIDPLYAYLIYIVVAGIAFVILLSIMTDSAIGGLLDGLPLRF